MALLNIRLPSLYIGLDAKLNAWIKDISSSVDTIITGVNALDSRQPLKVTTWADITSANPTVKPAKGAAALIDDHPMRGPCLLVGDGIRWHIFEELDTYKPGDPTIA